MCADDCSVTRTFPIVFLVFLGALRNTDCESHMLQIQFRCRLARMPHNRADDARVTVDAKEGRELLVSPNVGQLMELVIRRRLS